ncbi:DUF2171 domain-containing protein [Deinococcus peraridilitoris]|uniref:DUF2171 domain-containing protein n=1 Tax=Deinococcus peraridilitoris (strain DSM 19664 / LMG 22246 / CIP 109416 / KR-200) TaxID=937777 RepID=L0A6S8_DEIPD|nr:DUF2171 domain-containing protein [Deinococcus peraridilitoris]AFZ68735.1 hypothetical protein Deipe_3294 [Deinococcus peraridilitoris DSM 19664]
MDPNTRRSIQHHMGIRDINGQELGRVDHVEGDYVKITKDTDGNHHWIPDDLIMRVDQYVHLNLAGEEVMRQWHADDPNKGVSNDLQERHNRSDVQGERLHKTHEQRNDQQ